MRRTRLEEMHQVVGKGPDRLPPDHQAPQDAFVKEERHGQQGTIARPREHATPLRQRRRRPSEDIWDVDRGTRGDGLADRFRAKDRGRRVQGVEERGVGPGRRTQRQGRAARLIRIQRPPCAPASWTACVTTVVSTVCTSRVELTARLTSFKAWSSATDRASSSRARRDLCSRSA